MLGCTEYLPKEFLNGECDCTIVLSSELNNLFTAFTEPSITYADKVRTNNFLLITDSNLVFYSVTILIKCVEYLIKPWKAS